MALQTGTRIGTCEIAGLLGAGGMGEVYRGRDTKLGREVAIKALPATFLHDADRLARFEREARVLAALNHPNLAAIYDLVETHGSKYLILELVEGESLQQRLKRGAIPLSEALRLARQIADGLQAAHDKGIVHRDLKPGNILVTPDGRIKVLDFGLAKVSDVASAPQSLTHSPTITDAGTAQGVLLGTAPYMSPEQARGKAVNKQSDIWSFGCVLYEMLSGRQPFPTGETVTDTLARILIGEPDWTALPADTPPAIRQLLERCLRKEISARLRNIGDARFEIDDALERPERSPARSSAAAAPGWRESYLGGIAAALFLMTVVLGWMSLNRSGPPAPANRQSAGLSASLAGLFAPRVDNGPTALFNAAIPLNMTAGFYLSPDGKRLAFVADQKIWTRRLDSGAPEVIIGTRVVNFRHMFWSADSKEIGFLADGKLQKVAAAGGNVDVLGDTQASAGSWGSTGVILLGADDRGGPLLSIKASGGQPEPATELDLSRKEQLHRFPFFLPDGKHFLFFAVGKDAANAAYVGELGSRERHPLPGIASQVQYLNGHVLFIRDGKLMAQAFDADHLKLESEAFSVADDFVRPGTVSGQFSVSSTATLTYAALVNRRQGGGPSAAEGTSAASISLTNAITTAGGAERQLTWFDRKGKRLGVSGLPGQYSRPEVSPDGKYIAFERGIPTDIWILDTEKGYATQFTSDPGNDSLPRWSPDSTKLMFTSDRDGTPAIYQKALSGNTPEVKIPQVDDPKSLADVTMDGKSIVYAVSNLFWTVPLAANSQPIQITEPPLLGTAARVSPDGKWIALYVQGGLWVQSFPQPGFRQQLFTGPAIPRWRRDGREIFFLGAMSGVQSVLSVTVNPAPGGSVAFGPPTPVFPLPTGTTLAQIQGLGGVTLDGRFLLPIPAAAGTSQSITADQLAGIGTTRGGITVILNWRGNKS